MQMNILAFYFRANLRYTSNRHILYGLFKQ